MVTSAMNPMDYNQEMSRSVVQLGKKRVSSLCLPQATWHCNVVLRQQPVASAFLQVQTSALYSQIHVGVHAHVSVSATTDPGCLTVSFPFQGDRSPLALHPLFPHLLLHLWVCCRPQCHGTDACVCCQATSAPLVLKLKVPAGSRVTQSV